MAYIDWAASRLDKGTAALTPAYGKMHNGPGMPRYEYHCAANRRTVEVEHKASATVRTWGELCYAARIPLGRTRPAAPVRRVVRSAPAVAVETSNSELRNAGFTKLVKRDTGVYENVTASGGEARFMRRGKKETMPHLHKKIGD